MRPSTNPAGSRGSPAPGTEEGSSADLSSSLSQSIEDVSQDLVSYVVVLSPWRDGCVIVKVEIPNLQMKELLPLNGSLSDVLFQSSVLLLVLSEIACTLEVSGEDQVVAVEVLNMSPVQMGNIRVSDLLAGLLQGK